jgi:hypothetical protein
MEEENKATLQDGIFYGKNGIGLSLSSRRRPGSRAVGVPELPGCRPFDQAHGRELVERIKSGMTSQSELRYYRYCYGYNYEMERLVSRSDVSFF